MGLICLNNQRLIAMIFYMCSVGGMGGNVCCVRRLINWSIQLFCSDLSRISLPSYGVGGGPVNWDPHPGGRLIDWYKSSNMLFAYFLFDKKIVLTFASPTKQINSISWLIVQSNLHVRFFFCVCHFLWSSASGDRFDSQVTCFSITLSNPFTIKASKCL